ncbi:MAG TPA: hypothetical protein VLX90_21980 [Steroidobacteraceae bacterium]|nr:hypothetical protein [Steroidobacteraceae bacterium]
MIVPCPHLMACALFTGVVFALVAPVAADDPPASQPCHVAVVSPVSGFAECVDPRGAPVAQPPPRPPPTKEQCARHPELEVEACRREVKAPQGSSR